MKYLKRYNEDIEWEFNEDETEMNSIPSNYYDYKEELIGKKVKINKDSIYYIPGDPINPIDSVGTIIDISVNKINKFSGDLGIRVQWGMNGMNEIINSYSHLDLDLI